MHSGLPQPSRQLSAALSCACILLFAGCATAPRYTRGAGPQKNAARRTPPSEKGRFLQEGVASYYGPGFHGKQTANGERFDQYALTAAHRTLSFGTVVKVTNLQNGKSVTVRINDRGPFKKRRIIDLSLGAAKKIGLDISGTAKVRIERIK